MVILGFSRESMLIIPDFQGYFTSNSLQIEKFGRSH